MSALSAVRVLDYSNFFSAPLVSSLLGDFGAEVIKLEPPQGDGYRPTHLWPLIARNKKSVALDLGTPAGCDALRALACKADVIVENFSPALLKQRGHDWATLSALNPRLIMLSLSCFGQTGPYAGRPGNGTVSEAFAGLTHLTGPTESAPVLPSVALGDAVGALSAAFGVMTALYWRDAGGGRGQHIDATLYEPILHAISTAVASWKPGRTPKRLGNRLSESPLRNVYATADGGYVALGLTTSRQLRTLMDFIGASPDADPDSATAQWIKTRARDDVVAALLARGMLAAPINDLDQLLNDPQVQARASLMRVDDPDYGPLILPAPTPTLTASPGALRWVAAPLGAHNEEVLCGLAGLDRATMEAVTQGS